MIRDRCFTAKSLVFASIWHLEFGAFHCPSKAIFQSSYIYFLRKFLAVFSESINVTQVPSSESGQIEKKKEWKKFSWNSPHISGVDSIFNVMVPTANQSFFFSGITNARESLDFRSIVTVHNISKNYDKTFYQKSHYKVGFWFQE